MNFLKLILVDTILDVLYFPVWWYSRGMILALKWTFGEIAAAQEFLGVRIWVVNIFKPMYGQQDIASKIISFFMRVFQIILRLIILLLFCVFYLLIFIIYLALPAVVIYGIGLHLPAVIKS